MIKLNPSTIKLKKHPPQQVLSSLLYSPSLNQILIRNLADDFAGDAGGNDAGGDGLGDDAAGGDDTTGADGDAAEDGDVGAKPNIVLKDDGRAGKDLAALERVDRMARAGKAGARRDEGARADVDRRGIKHDDIVIDHGKAVKVDVEAIVAAKARTGEGELMVGSKKLRKDFHALGVVRVRKALKAFQEVAGLFLKLHRVFIGVAAVGLHGRHARHGCLHVDGLTPVMFGSCFPFFFHVVPPSSKTAQTARTKELILADQSRKNSCGTILSFRLDGTFHHSS